MDMHFEVTRYWNIKTPVSAFKLFLMLPKGVLHKFFTKKFKFDLHSQFYLYLLFLLELLIRLVFLLCLNTLFLS